MDIIHANGSTLNDIITPTNLQGKQILVSGSDADDYSDAQNISANKKSSNGFKSPSSPQTLAERLAGFRDLFFKALRVDLKYSLDDERWEYTEEPHVTRRQLILQKHPEIKQLFGYDPFIMVVVFAEVSIQIGMCVYISYYPPPWWLFVLEAYFISGFLNHSLGSAIHEIGHNLAFGHKRPWANRMLGIVANLPYGVPMAVSYRKYHQEHHRWLGHDTLDVDIPTRLEVSLFRSPLSKFLFLIVHPLIHSVRPFYKNYRPLWAWEVINGVVQIGFDLLILWTLGGRALGYLLLGTALGLGCHPLSGHFISEHYLFQTADHQATHSYYGPLNWIMFNLGYHVEHHDFPYVPYRKLPELRRIAHEFYDPLPYHTSWVKVVWDFIFSDRVGPHSRSITHECTSKSGLVDGMPSTPQYYEALKKDK